MKVSRMTCFLVPGSLLISCLLILVQVPADTVLTWAYYTPQPERDSGKSQGEEQFQPTSTPTPFQQNPASRVEEEQATTAANSESPSPPSQCVRCCDPLDHLPVYHVYQPVPQINITLLKGEKGDSGERGLTGKSGKAGTAGSRGHIGAKGQKGSAGAPGDPCKNHYSAFSVGRKKSLHSNDYYQPLIFDTELVNLYGHFNMFSGKFTCYVPGIYFFNLNVHTWNQKETYLHVMKNEEEAVILYAQPSDRSIMQSQSLMLQLKEQDEVWVRLFKGERENAVFSDDFDTYVTFNGYLIKASTEL
ncbi:complement C1q tumor necrosis factor-related protein 1 [Microcaecilia unicolor]|uniref:Complement C1q tumor necrosis factor-related protein 1 n=1 Tax=Microcaecilia unicolor TaxID=1415580 RepID=A0A6P7YBP9_9AMPH|nr:complement C1q tumor necrosis factor-related protein 1 [Microcaecilia unicolor]